MSWQFFTAISVLGISISILLQRILLRNKKTDPVAYSVFFQAIVATLLLIAAVANGFKLTGLSSVWLVALGSIILFGIGTIIYAKTLQIVEASAFSVLFATHAIWMMLLGIFLFNESLTILQVIGSLFIFASVIMLTKNVRSLSLDKGTAYGLITGILYGFALTGTAYVGKHTDTLSWAAVSFVGSAVVSFLVSPKAVNKISVLFKKDILPTMILLGVFYAIGSIAMLYAYKYGSYAVVSPLRQTGIVITVLLALVFLKPERNRIARKLIAATVSFVGIILILL